MLLNLFARFRDTVAIQNDLLFRKLKLFAVGGQFIDVVIFRGKSTGKHSKLISSNYY